MAVTLHQDSRRSLPALRADAGSRMLSPGFSYHSAGQPASGSSEHAMAPAPHGVLLYCSASAWTAKRRLEAFLAPAQLQADYTLFGLPCTSKLPELFACSIVAHEGFVMLSATVAAALVL